TIGAAKAADICRRAVDRAFPDGLPATANEISSAAADFSDELPAQLEAIDREFLARGLGGVSINVRITAVRRLAVEAADNGLLAPELANGITRVKGVASKGIRLGNWLSVADRKSVVNTPDVN